MLQNEKQDRMSFLDVQNIREDKTFTTFVYFKPIFSAVYKLTCRYFQIYSSWTKLHTELVYLKPMFLKNGYSENLINKCFKSLVDNIHVVKDTNLNS